MALISFREWRLKESSAATRAKRNYPDNVPDAAWHSHSTEPFPKSFYRKGKKSPPLHKEIDNWLRSVENLKKDVETLDKEKRKKKTKKKCQKDKR